MSQPLDNASMASLPAEMLPALAPLRTHPGLEAMTHGDRLWLRWQAGDDDILRCLLPIPGVAFCTRRDDCWYRLGQSLPAFDIPATWDGRALVTLLSPAPVEPLAPPSSLVGRVTLRLVRDDVPRPASALRCPLSLLARWADMALTADIEALRAAHLADAALLLGERLPPILEGERFWGRQVLVPLGLRPEPALPESALGEVLGLGQDDVALLRDGQAEVIAASALQPLTRAGVRRAVSG